MTTAVSVSEPFLEYRPLLFSIAYRMLGSAADAEDAVQETYLRWHRARQGNEPIHTPKGWLTTTISRVCLDQLGSARAKREQYIGPWLPEPLAGVTPDIADQSTDFDSISLAFMVLLESLTPKERAVFLLHDVFSYDFATVGEIVGETDAYCRQLAKRARARMTERRPRFTPDPEQQERLASSFMQAAEEGDMPSLIAMLTEDAAMYSDGGGKVNAARKPIVGRDKVATFIAGVGRLGSENWKARIETINGQPGILTMFDGAIFSVFTFEFAEDRIRNVFVVLNPDKLQQVGNALSLPVAPAELRIEILRRQAAERKS